VLDELGVGVHGPEFCEDGGVCFAQGLEEAETVRLLGIFGWFRVGYRGVVGGGVCEFLSCSLR
jgi:hypothetical protein